MRSGSTLSGLAALVYNAISRRSSATRSGASVIAWISSTLQAPGTYSRSRNPSGVTSTHHNIGHDAVDDARSREGEGTAADGSDRRTSTGES